jgi:nitrite reductase (NO-forming)
MNKRTRTIILCGILIVSAVLGALVPLSHIVSIDNNKVIKGGASEAEGSSSSNSTTTTTTSQTRKEYTLIAQDAELEIAPGKVVKTWTFNGTMPGPTLRFTEGDNVTIKFINKTPIPHTVHMHGNHDAVNDGVHHQVMPNETYLYNITAGPAGALMYHCHAYPTSLHIRMGMYGAMIVDPKDTPLPPAREFVMVLSEFDDDNIMKFETKYYPINGYLDQYVQNPIQVNRDELVRLYVINIGTTIPYQFHLHSTIFKAYPSGLLSNEPVDVQTAPVGPGDATLIEAKWKYPGTYLFHSHGFLEERGNMGQIVVSENVNENNNNSNQAAQGNETTRSISMIDWQYELQKKLQNPTIINYTDAQLTAINGSTSDHSGMIAHDNTTTFTQPTANASGASIPEDQLSYGNNRGGVTPIKQEISIVEGSSNPSNDDFYVPSPATVKRGSSVAWINNDSVPHTATSANPQNGEEAPTGAIFDSGIIAPGQASEEITINADTGTYDYYCTLHPFMKGQLTIEGNGMQ